MDGHTDGHTDVLGAALPRGPRTSAGQTFPSGGGIHTIQGLPLRLSRPGPEGLPTGGRESATLSLGGLQPPSASWARPAAPRCRRSVGWNWNE